ncbi:hypothetical protein [Magnetospira sp. QH-2]|uniref:hypothetical protein n=1 Tax=Magnetospira sp. (strain QH-2) TaxID=1288970 RepID=UPI0003E80F16|nr:hypothetical protein [Magnetospira sp. QH-2]CCQ74192.1 Protein of unknown function [Magnetospira sp. QH-2]
MMVLLFGQTYALAGGVAAPTLDTAIRDAVAHYYELPLEQVQNDTSLYKVAEASTQLGMDFRILGVRDSLEKTVNCRIADGVFETIRTVGDLLKAAHETCARP